MGAATIPAATCAPKERGRGATNAHRRHTTQCAVTSWTRMRACCEHGLAGCAVVHQGRSAALQAINCATDHFVALCETMSATGVLGYEHDQRSCPLCDATRRAQPLIGAVLEGPSRSCKLEPAGPWISCVWRLHRMRVLMYHPKGRRCFKMTGRLESDELHNS
jgi:hypothetical protein